jgi:hypothetical protein
LLSSGGWNIIIIGCIVYNQSYRAEPVMEIEILIGREGITVILSYCLAVAVHVTFHNIEI